MAKQNNFKSALNELMNGNLDMNHTRDEDPQNANTDYISEENSKIYENELEPIRRYLESETLIKPFGNSFIDEDLVIEGSIYGDSNIQMNGKVKGNITTANDLNVKGIVEGDAKAANITLIQSSIKGNVSAHKNLNVDSGSMILGNVIANSIEINGKVKGDVTAGDGTILKKDAIVFGNLTTKSISIEAGALVKGRLEVVSNSIKEKDFQFEGFASKESTREDCKDDKGDVFIYADTEKVNEEE